MKKATIPPTEQAAKSVCLFVQSEYIVLLGQWQWEMTCDAVFCSDVMLFLPPQFLGTKGIIHPDDLAHVKSAFALIREKESLQLQFRIITTYGEVKEITGSNLTIAQEEMPAPEPEKEAWEQADTYFSSRKQIEDYQLKQGISDTAERLHNLGTWYINATNGKCFYSDNVYRIHGLVPQVFNPHPNVFNTFIHPDDVAGVTDAFEKAYSEQLPLHLEYRIVKQNGDIRQVQQITRWSFNEKGESVLSGVLHDLTEQKALETRIEQAEATLQFYRQTLQFGEQQMGAANWTVHLLTRKTAYSDNYYRLHGLKPQATINPNHFLNVVHPDDQKAVEEATSSIFSRHQAPDLEYRIIRPDGKTRYLRQAGKLVVTPNNEMIMMVNVQDITVQKVLEKKVQQLQEEGGIKNNTLNWINEITGINTIIWQLPEGNMTWSESLYKLIGCKPQTEPTQSVLLKNILPADRERFADELKVVLETRAEKEIRFRMIAKGELRQMRALFKPAGTDGNELILGLLQDISKEASLQHQLTEQIQMATLMAETIYDALIVTDITNTIVNWNRQCEEKTGIKKAEALNKNFFDVFPHLKDLTFVDYLRRAQGGETVKVLEAKSIYLKGYQSFYLSPVINEEQVIGVVHVVHDFSREHDLQRHLNERLNFIESLVEASVDRIIVLDRHMNYLYWNKKAEDYYSISKEKVLGKNILEVFPSLRNDPSYQEFRKVLKGETVHIPATINEDSEGYFETYLTPIKDDNENVSAVLWVVHDLSKEYHLQLKQQEGQRRLQKEHHRLKEAQAIGHVGSFEWDAATDTIYWSDEMYRIHGLEPQSQIITLEKVFSFFYPDDLEESKEKMLPCRNEATTVVLTHRIIRADGEVRYVVRQLQSFANEEGKVTHLTGTVQDITEQQKTEAQLKEQSHYLRRITETVPYMVSVMELPSRKIHYLNKETFAANGFDPDQMVNKSKEELINLIHSEDRSVLNTYYQSFDAASDEDTITAEYRAKGSLGKWQWYYVRGKVFQRDAAGKVTHILNVIENITNWKKIEREIKQSNDLLQSVFDASLHGIILFKAVRDKEGNIQDYQVVLNNAVTQHWNGRDLIGKLYGEEFSNIRQHGIFDAYNTVLQTGEPIKMEVKYEGEGFKNWYTITAVKVNEDELVATAEDITERKTVEEEIKKNFSILQQTEELVQIGSWEYDIPTGNFIWSEGMYRLFGLPKGAPVSPGTYIGFSLQEDHSVAKRIVKNLEKTHQSFEETLRIKRDGNIRLLKIKGSVVLNENGKPQKILGVDLDITEIKEAEEKLKQSQRWLQHTAETSPDAITIYDLAKKQPFYLNNCLAKWLGITPDELVAMGIKGRLELIHPDDRLRLLHFNEKVIAAPDGKVLNIEYRLRTKEDSWLWIRNRAKVFEREAKGKVTHILSVLQDVTEEKEAEAALKELNKILMHKNKELEEKNEEITQFAFIASHDLREPLRKIHTFSDWLLKEEKEHLSETAHGYLTRMKKAVDRMNLLIDDILVLSRVHTSENVATDVPLSAVMDKVKVELHKEITESGATINIPELPALKGNPTQLFHLFKNLISNAVKFQEKGHQPVVTITYESVPGSSINNPAAQASKMYGKLCIKDNGIGFDDQDATKIFHVFHRLHSLHEYSGTGMGLTVCKKIMENHGGFITAHGKPDRGAAFCCYFPL